MAVIGARPFIKIGPAEEIFRQPQDPTPGNSSPPSPSFPAPDLCRGLLPFIAPTRSCRPLVSDRDLGYNPGAEIFSGSGAYFDSVADSEI